MSEHKCIQGDRVTTLEVTDKFLMKEIGEIKTDVKEIHKKLDDFIEHAPDKFAPIWVEKSIKRFAGIIIGAIILALLSLIIK